MGLSRVLFADASPPSANDNASSSAHQIHRNDNYPDGAIVVDATSASPTYLLFRYDNQVF